MRHTLIRHREAVAIFLVLVSWSVPASADLTPQPPKKKSMLIDKDRQGILDSDFATLAKNILVSNGKSNARDAKFLFQECFGGGMLDDIQKALGNVVKWVGGAAARHDEEAHDLAAGNIGIAYWTQSLAPQMNQDQTLIKAIDAANAALKPAKETGQSIFANGGDTITLKDPQAASHHAILWGGQANKGSHTTNIDRIRESLIKQWGAVGQTVTITVLFGNGKTDFKGNPLPAAWNAQAATKANLEKTFADIGKKMNPNEQFFFYGTGHGNVRTVMLDAPQLVPGQTVDVESFDLSEGELDGLLAQDDNQPTLEISYDSLIDPVEVYFNNELLGSLDPGLTFKAFDVPEPLVHLDGNEVRINNFSDYDFVLNDKAFLLGPIDLISVVPEPGTAALLLVGLAGVGLWWCRRPKTRRCAYASGAAR